MLKGESRPVNGQTDSGSGEPQTAAGKNMASESPRADALRSAPTATRLAYFAMTLVRRPRNTSRRVKPADNRHN